MPSSSRLNRERCGRLLFHNVFWPVGEAKSNAIVSPCRADNLQGLWRRPGLQARRPCLAGRQIGPIGQRDRRISAGKDGVRNYLNWWPSQVVLTIQQKLHMLTILFLFVPHFLVVRLRFELPTVVYRCSFFAISEHTLPIWQRSGQPPRPKTARSKTHPRSHLRWAQAWPRHAVRPMGAHGCRTGPPAEDDRRELPLIDSPSPTRQGPK